MNKENKDKKIRLNFGSARDKKDGFMNVDGLDWDGNTDYLWDLTEVPYPLDDESVEEIRSVETLEHISFRHITNVLAEWHRILKIDGKITIGVPDCGSMMEMYVNDEICECIPHKPKRMSDLAPSRDCPDCNGRGRVNPIRWMMAFNGASKHKYDYHLNFFTEDSLREALQRAGFEKIRFSNDPMRWKLRVKATK